ncbi:MAG: biotin/lipoyl-binding protein [Cenarchaeum sp. SB0664_bin_35]|nr:biotin/lipoyl-binding protein [Cenarchaeum sp. SB0664_bin_35]
MDYMVGDIKHSVTSVDDSTLMIDGTPYDISIISISPNGIEFLLNKRYFQVIYAEESRGQTVVHVNGSPVTLRMHTGLDDIVYMHSGGAGAAMTDSTLQSQIPGKVVSITVSVNDEVSEGDTICVLESMKMQVSVKAHTSGSIKSMRVKVGSSVAKGDIIAEIE